MPPLHIKLGLMKQLVKGLDRESAAFRYLNQKFPQMSEEKIRGNFRRTSDQRTIK